MTKLIHEVFDEVALRESREDKIAVLRFNSTWALKNVLRGTFDPNVQFVFETVPEYRPSDAPVGLGYTSVHQELGRAYIFEKNNPKTNSNLDINRRTQILVQILEALEAREAEVFANMIRKDLKIDGLDYSLVKEAFPELLP